MPRMRVLALASLLVLTFPPALRSLNQERTPPTLEQIREAAEGGNMHGQFMLGRAYERGQGVERDLNQARFWYEKAAEQGQIEAMFYLSLFHARGIGGLRPDRDVSLHWLRKAAEAGNPFAEWNLSQVYCSGGHPQVKQDIAECFRWMRRAGDRGLAQAQTGLAHHYFTGKLVERDLQEAEHWARQSADQLHYPGITLLARIYREQGAGKSLKVVERLHGMAADLGAALSQADLGRMYREGAFGEPDYARAYERFAQAAAQRFAPAQFALGEMHELGQGVAPNDAEALKWYRRAASNGWAPAHCKVGLFLREGRGGPTDGLRALMHFGLGAKLKAEECLGPRQALEGELSGPRAREAEALAGEWEMENPLGTAFPAGEYSFSRGVMVPWPGEGPTQKRGPSTAEERQWAVELARKLEREPSNAGADEDRRALMKWWDEIPERVVFHCGGLLEQPRWSPVYLQYLFSSGAFLLQNPGEAPDDPEALTAGLEGALRVYEALVRAERAEKTPHLEMLRGLTQENRLGEWVVRERRSRCRILRAPPGK